MCWAVCRSYVVCPSCHAVEPLTGKVMETMKACEAVLCKACNEDEMRFKVGVVDSAGRLQQCVGVLCRTIEVPLAQQLVGCCWWQQSHCSWRLVCHAHRRAAAMLGHAGDAV